MPEMDAKAPGTVVMHGTPRATASERMITPSLRGFLPPGV